MIPTLFIFILIRGNNLERFAVCWVLVTLVPVVMFSEPSSLYLYLPAIGFAVLFGEVLGTRILQRFRNRAVIRNLLAACLTLFLLLSAFGAFLGNRRFADRTASNRSIARQIENIDGEYSSGQKTKLVGVPHVLADPNGITSMIHLFATNLVPYQSSDGQSPGLVVYGYVGPGDSLVLLK